MIFGDGDELVGLKGLGIAGEEHHDGRERHGLWSCTEIQIRTERSSVETSSFGNG
jgi:hypothetical protein